MITALFPLVAKAAVWLRDRAREQDFAADVERSLLLHCEHQPMGYCEDAKCQDLAAADHWN